MEGKPMSETQTQLLIKYYVDIDRFHDSKADLSVALFMRAPFVHSDMEVTHGWVASCIPCETVEDAEAYLEGKFGGWRLVWAHDGATKGTLRVYKLGAYAPMGDNETLVWVHRYVGDIERLVTAASTTKDLVGIVDEVTTIGQFHGLRPSRGALIKHLVAARRELRRRQR